MLVFLTSIKVKGNVTKFVMLCDKGVFLPTAPTTSGIFALITLPSKSLDTAAGSSAAMIALTTATPSRDLCDEADWASTSVVLEALMPPMQTVGMEWPAWWRAERISETPEGPMMDFVSFLLARGLLVVDVEV